jgi:hypothetical protein
MQVSYPLLGIAALIATMVSVCWSFFFVSQKSHSHRPATISLVVGTFFQYALVAYMLAFLLERADIEPAISRFTFALWLLLVVAALELTPLLSGEREPSTFLFSMCEKCLMVGSIVATLTLWPWA